MIGLAFLGLAVLMMGAGLFACLCDRTSSLDRVGAWLAGESEFDGWQEDAAGAYYRKDEVTK